MGKIIAVGILFLLLGLVLTKYATSKKSDMASNVGKIALAVGITIIVLAFALIVTWVALKIQLFAVELGMKLFKYLGILAAVALVVFVISQAVAKKKQ